jgi:hypothetical protein
MEDSPDDADILPALCRAHAACFSWCGTLFADRSCHAAEDVVIEAEALGPLLCDPLVIDVVDGPRLAPGVDEDDARCFLQVLRYGHAGVVQLYWSDGDRGRSGHLVVQGLGEQYVRLEMRIEGAAPDCGDAIALHADRAHVLDPRDPLFDACLDRGDEVELAACVLGPAASFYDGHDWVFDVAFPWLSGTCGV